MKPLSIKSLEVTIPEDVKLVSAFDPFYFHLL